MSRVAGDSESAHADRASGCASGNVCFQIKYIAPCTSEMVKGFGCRQAYESLPCGNPRATINGYGDFDLRGMSATRRPPLGSVGMEQRGGFVVPPRSPADPARGSLRRCRRRRLLWARARRLPEAELLRL